MKIDFLCSDPTHPVNERLKAWIAAHIGTHDCALRRRKAELAGGDILFLVSCTEIIDQPVRDLYGHALVLHASDLPAGRGWSPHIWAILEGAGVITISILDAEDRVDTGAVWAKERRTVPKHALYDEINAVLFDAELALMDRAIEMIQSGQHPVAQSERTASYWPRRRPEDSEVDPEKSIRKLFDAIRVADPDRYPAFFRLNGHVYTIALKKVSKNDSDPD
ncbi:hypothetical protein P775_06395 [Puniceibacterium antarcticum]|uniref:Formyl transferase N-terminal domain-containing protein n=1 Tax=Puniceibacterium antarcticum TaxID=1206336 RepID=A0A2G8RHD7_9RHOB|nr:formyltransferase family protein [Puniceibacterium antarcticum]PIL20994.1 hypothetical protein P775_06395 [Puniceibacterium antarcticum]